MRRVFGDVWIQLFLLLALESGLLSAGGIALPRIGLPRALARLRAPAPAPAAEPVQPEARIADAVLPPAAPAPAPPSGGPKILLPRAKGVWVVDVRSRPDADSDKLGDVLLSVADGDRVRLRPGVYKVGALVSYKSITIVGEGASPDDVVIEAGFPQVFRVAVGRLALENLTLSQTALARSACVAVSAGASVQLTKVKLKAEGQSLGVHVEGGTVKMSDCALESGGMGVLAKDASRLRVDRCRFSGVKDGLVVTGAGSVAEVYDSTFDSGEYGVLGAHAANLTLARCSISKMVLGLALVNADTFARASEMTFSGNSKNYKLQDMATAVIGDAALQAPAEDGPAPPKPKTRQRRPQLRPTRGFYQ